MIERRPTPAVLALGLLIAAAGIALLLTGSIEWAAVAGGFIPLRIGADPETLRGAPAMLPLWVTPLSATMIHGGIAHLGFNLLMLAIAGSSAERAVGVRGIAILWLVGAYAAVAAQWLVDPMSPIPMIGASGALSAVVGSYSLLYGEQRARAIGPVPAHVVNALWLGAGWVGLNLLMGWFARQAGLSIAVAAHVGGFVAGMVLLRPLLRWRWGVAANG